MEWLKDKKNLPVVAGLGVLVLVLAIAAILFETGVIGGGGQTAPVDTTAAAPLPPPASAPGDAPPPGTSAPGPQAPGRPGAPGAQAAAKPVVKVPTNVAKGTDPFSVSGANPLPTPGRTITVPKPRVSSFVQPIYISTVTAPSSLPFQGGGPISNGPPSTVSIPNIRLTPTESQTMRVSGVVLTNGSGVRAVLEANGQSLTVQPGDTVPGGRVISIQSDGLTMKADDGSVIHVPIGNGNSGNPQGG